MGGRIALSKTHRKAIAHRIEEVRKRRGLSKGQLGHKVKSDEKAAGRWTHPKDPSTPDVVRLVQLAKQLGVSLDWLLLGRGEPDYRPEVATRVHPADVASELRAVVVEAMGKHGVESDIAERLVPAPLELLDELKSKYQQMGRSVVGGSAGALLLKSDPHTALESLEQEAEAVLQERDRLDVLYLGLDRLRWEVVARLPRRRGKASRRRS